MSKVNKKQILADYQKFKQHAFLLFEQNNTALALKYIELCAKIAYKFNFRYNDDKLEELLVKISTLLFAKIVIVAKSEKYVFHDYFGLDNKGLTQQYIRALMAMDVEFLYIMEQCSDENQGQGILKELKAYPKAQILIVKDFEFIAKMQRIRLVIEAFRPTVAFLHFVPWDVVGVVVWNSVSNVKRYFINLTDHAFWLGKSCGDYFLEFRNYSYNISIYARGINENKLLYQPYYPIRSINQFNGFDFDITSKKIGFSGGAYYKIGGRNNAFLKLIKKVIAENPNFIFLFAGSGNVAPIRKFIVEEGLEKKIILLGNRNDLDEILKQVNVFIGTYPYAGGLITQLAIINKVPIVIYTTSDLAFNYIEDMIRVDKSKVSTKVNEEDFLKEVKLILNDEEYAKENIRNYENSIPTIAEFNEHLQANIFKPKASNFKYTIINIDYDVVFNLYIENENEFSKNYHSLILETLKLEYLRSFPLGFINSFFNVLKNHPQIIKNYLKKSSFKTLIKTI